MYDIFLNGSLKKKKKKYALRTVLSSFKSFSKLKVLPTKSKVTLKILQGRLQDVNQELPDVQAGFRKGRGARDQIAHLLDHRKCKGQKNIYFCLIDYSKGFDCVDHHRLWKILQEMGILDYRTFLLCNLHAGHPVYLTYMQSTSHEMPG